MQYTTVLPKYLCILGSRGSLTCKNCHHWTNSITSQIFVCNNNPFSLHVIRPRIRAARSDPMHFISFHAVHPSVRLHGILARKDKRTCCRGHSVPLKQLSYRPWRWYFQVQFWLTKRECWSYLKFFDRHWYQVNDPIAGESAASKQDEEEYWGHV